jgi:hypothetical protein
MPKRRKQKAKMKARFEKIPERLFAISLPVLA